MTERQNHDEGDDNSGDSRSENSLFVFNAGTGRIKSNQIGYQEKNENKKKKYFLDRKADTFHGVFIQKLPFIFGLVLYEVIAPTIGKSGIIAGIFVILICSIIGILSAISFATIASNGKLKEGSIYRLTKYAFGRPFASMFTLLAAFSAANSVIWSINKLGYYLIITNQITSFVPDSNHSRMYLWIFLILIAVAIASALIDLPYFGITVNIFWIYSVVVLLHVSIVLFIAGVYIKGPKEKFCISNNGFIVDKSFNCSTKVKVFDEVKNLIIDDKWEKVPIRHQQNIFHLSCMKYNKAKYLVKDASQRSNYTRQRTTKNDHKESFIQYLTIFFFAITSVFTFANSQSLKNSLYSIPCGLISGIAYASIVYIIVAILVISLVDRRILIDHKSKSTGGIPIFIYISYPNQNVALIIFYYVIIFQSVQTFSYAVYLVHYWLEDFECLCIKNKKILSCTRFTCLGFKPVSTIIVFGVCSILLSLNNNLSLSDFLTTLSFIFLFYIHFICLLKMLFPSVEWRPSFKCIHWSIPFVGALSCLFLQFATISYNFKMIFAIPLPWLLIIVFEYMEAKTFHSDGRYGLLLELATISLNMIGKSHAYIKSTDEVQLIELQHYKPQFLVVLPTVYKNNEEENENNFDGTVKLRTNLENHIPMMEFCKLTDYMSAMIIVNWMFEGKHKFLYKTMSSCEEKIHKYLYQTLKLNAFIEISCSENPDASLISSILTAGIGPLKPNIVLLPWISKNNSDSSKTYFYETLKACQREELSIIIFQKNKFSLLDKRFKKPGYIDVFAFPDDNGFGILYAFLLKRSVLWKKQIIRFNVIVSNSTPLPKIAQMNANFAKFLHYARINAQIHFLRLGDLDTEKVSRSIQRSFTGMDSKEAEYFGNFINHVQTRHKRSRSQDDLNTNSPAPIEENLKASSSNNLYNELNEFVGSKNIDRKIKKMSQAVAVNKLIHGRLKVNPLDGIPSNLVILNMPKLSRYVDNVFFDYTEQLSKDIPNILFVDSQKSFITLEI